jgi:hypothetical protein
MLRPPISEVLSLVHADCGVVVAAVTVSTSPAVPQVLEEDWLLESPEYLTPQ